jgi:hypothetical protein
MKKIGNTYTYIQKKLKNKEGVAKKKKLYKKLMIFILLVKFSVFSIF